MILGGRQEGVYDGQCTERGGWWSTDKPACLPRRAVVRVSWVDAHTVPRTKPSHVVGAAEGLPLPPPSLLLPLPSLLHRFGG